MVPSCEFVRPMGTGLIKLLAFAALGYVIYWIYHDVKRQLQSTSPNSAPPQSPAELDDAYAVLGLNPDATMNDVKSAYQALVQQYHPDRVADLGPELQEVAERKTKELNAAYGMLKKKRR